MFAADVIDLMDLNFSSGSGWLAETWQRTYRPLLDHRALVSLLPPGDPGDVWVAAPEPVIFGVDIDARPYWVDPLIAAGEIPQANDGTAWLAEVQRYAVTAHVLNQTVAAEERYADRLKADEARKYRKTLTTQPLAVAAQAGLDLLGDGWQELLPTNQKPNSRKALSRW